jgi:hypothetical protein
MDEEERPSFLSASQKAYQEDPEGFIQRLSARAESLYENGYLALPTADIHVFEVINLGAKHQHAYRVNALLESCTCPFYRRQAQGERLTENGKLIRCKHHRGLPLLIRKTRQALYQANRKQECCELWAHWMKTLTVVRQRRTSPTLTRKEREI